MPRPCQSCPVWVGIVRPADLVSLLKSLCKGPWNPWIFTHRICLQNHHMHRRKKAVPAKMPAMHVMVLKADSVRKYPWIPRALTEAFKKAHEICRAYYADPNWTTLAWTRHLFEEEQEVLDRDLWPIGLAGNGNN